MADPRGDSLHHHRTWWIFIGLLFLVLSAPGVSAQRPLVWQLHEQTAPWRDRLQSGHTGTYALIGDSISFRIDSFNWYLRDELEAIYGNGGDGYLALNSSFRHIPDGSRNRRPGLAFRHSGQPWTTFGPGNGARSAFGERSIDGLYARIGATGWVEVDCYGPQITLHYIREEGAGVIRIRVNGEVIAEIDASIGPGELPGLMTYSFSTGTNDPNVLSTVRFSLVGATSQNPMWTQLNGLDMRTGEPGVVYHRLARGGSGPDDFLRADPMMELNSLTALDPDAIFIMLDQTTDLAQYTIDLALYVERINVATPGVPVVLISHHAFSPTRETTTEIELLLAIAQGYGFLNLFDLHNNFDHLNDLGFLIDSVHFSSIGGDWYGRFVRDALLGWRVPTSEMPLIGTVLEGELYELRAIDDDGRRLRSRPGFGALEPYLCEQAATFHVESVAAAELSAAVRVRSDTPNTTARLRLRRLTDGAWVTVAAGAVGPEPTTLVAENVDASNYLNPLTGEVQSSVRATHVAVFSSLGFVLSIDRMAVGIP